MIDTTADRLPLSRRLKVLFITSWYPTRQNPVGGVFVREHAQAVRLFDDVAVLHLQGAGSDLNRAWCLDRETDPQLAQGISTYRLQVRPSPVLHTSFLLAAACTFQAFHRFRRLEYKPDLLHAHIHRAGFQAVLLGKLFRLPVVITEHNSAFPRRMLRKPDIALARYAFSRAQAVLPVSHALQQGIEQYSIRANWRLVPNAVDTGLFTPRPLPPGEKKRLLFVGNLTPVKGLPFLFDALASLRLARDDWRLDIVGDGSERQAYLQRVQELNLADYVTFHGQKSKQEVAAFMQSASLFVLPSLWDNMPCVLVEAMASGLPIVSTRAGGIPEMITPETGLLVPPGDAGELCQALHGMLDRLAAYDRLAIARAAQQYSHEHVGRLIHSIYLDAIREHHEPAS